VAEAVALLAEHGPEAKALAGGQSLMPLLNLRLAAPRVLVDLNRVAGLDGLSEAEGELRVGALVRQRTLERSEAVRERCRLLAAALPFVGHVATRNRGTVGGSVAHADAAAELPVCLVALGGSVLAQGAGGTRTIAADDLYLTHLTSALAEDEVLVEVRVPLDQPGSGAGFAEVAPRHGDYAVGMIACRLEVAGGVVRRARIAAGAVADRPVLLLAAAAALEGGAPDAGRLEAAAAAARAAVEPTDGLHAPAAYRRHLVGVLVQRAVRRAWDDAVGRGPRSAAGRPRAGRRRAPPRARSARARRGRRHVSGRRRARRDPS
jgi:CO/xanthine dehydrogenase FAD-binding subunit